jgi:CHAT domain-containing protein
MDGRAIFHSSCVGIAALALGATCFAVAASPSAAPAAFEHGLAAYHEGRFEEAVRAWARAEQTATVGSPTWARAGAHRGLALQALGRHREAVEALRAVAGARGDSCDRGAEPHLLDALGGAYLMAGLPQAARGCFAFAQERAEALGDPALLAVVFNNQGLLAESQEQHEDALAAYVRSIVLADASGAVRVATRARVNLALLMQSQPERSAETDAAWRDAVAHAERIPHEYERATLLTSLGAIARPWLSPEAQFACEKAAQLARRRMERREEAAALDCRAALFERAGEFTSALRFARQALTLARGARAPDLEYVIEGRVARLANRLGREAEALAAYRRAIAIVESMHNDLAIGQATRRTSFRDAVEPHYRELADLLLTRARQEPAGKAVPLLAETREVLERLKAAELRDYFQDDCVDALRARRQRVEQISASSAVLYAVVLGERTELLVSFADGSIEQHTLAVTRRALAEQARALRFAVSDPGSGAYLAPARQLEAWLISGLEKTLRSRGIDTLAFVPDGPLRGVPFAALHDGERFLVERYAIATIPGLELIESRPLVIERSQPLLAGHANAYAAFPPLPHVVRELDGVHEVVGGRVLREFSAADLERELTRRPHDIVHIASHGLFTGDASRSFLVSAEGELALGRLQRLLRLTSSHERPVELLVLSACETASGDERAALGMAGLALQAGARSALATLWQVNDAATAELMQSFYRALSRPGSTKAGALRQAQLALLAGSVARYQHPFYWAPFVLVGHWS